MSFPSLFGECAKFALRKENLNKFTITGGLFFVWIAFFDNYNLIEQVKLKNAVYKLQLAKVEQEHKLADAIQAKEDLENNMEKFAREKFFMHKENEDIIKIERK